MDKKLKQLFDYQLFEDNPRLSAMLSHTKEKYDFSDNGELSDDEVGELNAAGSVVVKRTAIRGTDNDGSSERI